MVRLLWVLWASVALFVTHEMAEKYLAMHYAQSEIELRIEYELMLIEKGYFDMQYPKGRPDDRA